MLDCAQQLTSRAELLLFGVGVGGLSEPAEPLDFGNSGTGARLVMGLVAGHPITATFIGDASLSRRPMGRVINPLTEMGAHFHAREGGRMPLTLTGARQPMPITYRSPVASAQVKSAIMLAGLNTPGTTTVIEGEATRDHTEHMLKAFGADLDVTVADDGVRRISLTGYAELEARDVVLPGDPSSAAFPGVAALMVPGSDVTIENIGLNPLRAGLFETLQEMDADIEITNVRDQSGEPVGDITFRHGPLTGADIPAARAPSMIDEYPIAAMAAAVASGETRFRGLAELRVKESDRFAAIVDGLVACGVPARADGDDIVVTGQGGPPPGGAEVHVNLDHRIAMAYLVLGLASAKPVTIDDAAAIETSFPGFLELMTGLGADIAPVGD